MKAFQLSKDIYWVGAIDWDIRNFHGYLTQRGSTYNAYLIIDEKIVLVDTVKASFSEEMLERISSIIDLKKIDYIVSNHVEMDHSGTLPQIMEHIPNATIITSAPMGEKGLRAHYQQDWNFKPVKSGDSLSIGKRKLSFHTTPMVHWPDNMVTYCDYENLLFSNDAFGQHIASYERLDDEYPLDTILFEAKKYYANIVLPYGNQVHKALDALSSLKINTIAPSHGLIWRKNIPAILDKYKSWMQNQTKEKAIIIYDSMWQSTNKMANTLYSAFESMGITCSKFQLQQAHISDAMTELLDAKYICVGSPTLNNQMLPTVSAFLTYLKGLAPKNRIACAFGSYGWSGQSIQHIEDILASLDYQILPQIKANYIPYPKTLSQIENDFKAAIKECN